MLENPFALLIIGQLPEITYSVVVGIGYLLCISGAAFLCIGIYQSVIKLRGKYVPLFLISCVLLHGTIDLAIGLMIARLFERDSLVWSTMILLRLIAYSIGSNFARRWYLKRTQVTIYSSSGPIRWLG